MNDKACKIPIYYTGITNQGILANTIIGQHRIRMLQWEVETLRFLEMLNGAAKKK
jgi:hypothetical protein